MLREDPFRLRQSNPDQMIHLDTQWTLSAGSLKAASLLSSACSRFQSHEMFFFSMKKPLHLSSWPRTLVLVPPRDLQVPVVGTDHLGEPANVLLQHQVPRHVCLRVGVQCRHVDLQMLIVTSKNPTCHSHGPIRACLEFICTSEKIALSTAFLASCRWSSLVAASIGSCSRASHNLKMVE